LVRFYDYIQFCEGFVVQAVSGIDYSQRVLMPRVSVALGYFLSDRGKLRCNFLFYVLADRVFSGFCDKGPVGKAFGAAT
jgi:hypothetical protein